GSVERGELILRFRSTSAATNVYQALLDEYTKRANLLQIEPSKDDSEDRTVLMTFDVIMKRETDINQMVAELAELVGVSEVRAIASKTDIDY
ncbi:MAG: hypothetical protein QGH43_11720, partial [Arenicellales bacterium]|nr:hypothetical protein [Arenicellales bacterium]